MQKYRSLRPRRGPLPFRYVFLITFIFFIFSTALGLWIVNKGIQPALEAYAINETKRIATLVIKKAIDKQISEEEFRPEDLFTYQTDDEGNITVFNVNTNTVNKVLTRTVDEVEKYLKYVNDGNVEALELPEVEMERDENRKYQGFYYTIPLGEATNNVLLGNLGPQIPVRFHMVGDVVADYSRKMEEIGINNYLLEVVIDIEVTVHVIIPFSTAEITVPTSVPVVVSTINGKVPDFYNNGGDTGPSIEFPTN